jgi:hypothetical protein
MNDTTKDTQPLEGELIPAKAAGMRQSRHLRLTTARALRRELAAVYAAFRRGDLSSEQTKTSVYVLRTLGEMLRLDEIESRLAALEQKQ